MRKPQLLNFMLLSRLLFGFTAASLFALTGCRDSKIASYRVRKEALPPPTVAASPGGAPRLLWKAPAGWQEQPAGNVRIASFLITADGGRKADMSVTQFPGDVGGDLANLNRWRGQLQLPPIAESELGNFAKPLDLPVGKFLFTDLLSDAPILEEGKQHARIIGAWLKQPERTWFFKLTGEAELVSAQRDAFQSFLRSLEFTAAEMPAVGETPAGGEMQMPPAAPAAPLAASGSRQVTWTAPSDWTTKPLGQMRKGSFSLHGADGGEADLSIISFPGEAGGMVENLNRWRRQIQLEPLSAGDLATSSHTIANAGLRITVVDYVGTTAKGPTRLLGAVLPLETETYFFKLTGPDNVVSQHKTAFMDFLKTVKTQ
jgi:hypothetical protein